MIDKTRNYISDILSLAKNPCVFWSAGKDSSLLLHLVRSQRSDIPVFYFGDSLNSLAEHAIIDYDLTVYSYPPADRYLVPNGEGIAMIDEYDLRGVRIPFVSRITEGENCKHSIPNTSMPHFNFTFDYTFLGMKQGETCEAVGVTFPKELDLGTTKIVCPLYEWTDDEVVDFLDRHGLPYAKDTNDWEMCAGCLQEIEASNWDRELSLSAFRNRFQFH